MDNLINTPVSHFMEKWQLIERGYEEYAKSNGLTYMSFTILDIIYRNVDCCTQKLICEQSLYTKQSVNTIIKNFYEQGYIKLKEEKSDRRNKQILFTKKGQIYADEIIGKCIKIEEKAMKKLTSEQWGHLIEMAETFGKDFVLNINNLIKEKEKK